MTVVCLSVKVKKKKKKIEKKPIFRIPLKPFYVFKSVVFVTHREETCKIRSPTFPPQFIEAFLFHFFF